MSVDLTTIIVTLLTLLVGGGSTGLVQAIRADRKQKREKAEAARAAAPQDEVSVTEAIRRLARDAIADADDRLDVMREETSTARREATAARAESSDARAMVELLSRQLAQATQHIRDLEPLLRAGGIPVPPWPPDPDGLDPVMSHDRRHHDVPHDGPDRRRGRRHAQEDPHGT